MTTLLLTATIDPRSTVFVLRSDPRVRLDDYCLALRQWLAAPGIERIVFCENSGADLARLRSVAQEAPHRKSLEFLSYTAPESECLRGKGYGEMGILSHVISALRLQPADGLLKVTGRHFVANAAALLADIHQRHRDAAVVTSPSVSGRIPTECFYATAGFLAGHLLENRELVNDCVGYHMEHAMARAVASAVAAGLVHAELAATPDVAGVSGTTNLPLKVRRHSGLVHIALPADHVRFLRATLGVANGPQPADGRVAAALDARLAGLDQVGETALPEVGFSYAELGVIRLGILNSLLRPEGYLARTGFSEESAKLFARALEPDRSARAER